MTHKLNQDKTVAVAVDYFWIPIGTDTPRGVKLQLLTVGGIAIHGIFDGKMNWVTHWAPLPRKLPDDPAA
jgi:hypothetical protein